MPCLRTCVIIAALGLSVILCWLAAPLMADDLTSYKKWTYLATPHRAYEHFCASCHGTSGDGEGRFFPTDITPRPRNFTAKEAMSSLSDEDIKRAITHGTAAIGKSGLCPPWGKALGQDRVEQLVSFIRSFSVSDNSNNE